MKATIRLMRPYAPGTPLWVVSMGLYKAFFETWREAVDDALYQVEWQRSREYAALGHLL